MRGIYILLTALAIMPFFSRVDAQPANLDSLFKDANQFRTNGEYLKSIAVYRDCLARARELKDTLKTGNALIGIGIANDEEGNFDDALQYYFEALKVYETIGNEKKIGGTLKNIGNTYRVLKQYDKAFSFLGQALELQTRRKDSAAVGNVFNDIAIVYYDQDSTEQALSYLKKIYSKYDHYLGDEARADVRNNIGLTYAKMHRYPEAFPYYRAALQIMTARKDQYGIALVTANTGDLFYGLKDYRRALEYHLKNLAIARQIRSNELLLTTYDNLRKTYEAIGDHGKAYEFAGYEMAMKDSVYDKQRIAKYEEMNAKYQDEKKQQQIQLLEKDKRLSAIELSIQQRTKYFLLAGILLTLILFALLYKSYRNKRASNNVLNHLNQKLSEANGAKAKLISIISHDLRGPISSLFNFIQLQKDNPTMVETEGRDMLSEKVSQSAENLLETMEDLLFWSKSQMDQFEPAVEKVDTGELLDGIISLYEDLAADKHITLIKGSATTFKFYTDPNFIKIVLRNLTSNALKFTPAHGVVSLFSEKRDITVLLSVKDNGPGLNAAQCRDIFEWNSIRSDSSGFGLRLAKEFTEKMGGRLVVSSMPGQGAEFTVSLPLRTP